MARSVGRRRRPDRHIVCDMLVHGFPLVFVALIVLRIVYGATRASRRNQRRADRYSRRGYQPSGLGMPAGMPFPGQGPSAVVGDPNAAGQFPGEPYAAEPPFPGTVPVDPYAAGQPLAGQAFPGQADSGPFALGQPVGGFGAATTPDPVHEDRGATPIPTMPDPTQSSQTFSDPTFGGGFNSSPPTPL
jgi:hypothetical protein